MDSKVYSPLFLNFSLFSQLMSSLCRILPRLCSPSNWQRIFAVHMYDCAHSSTAIYRESRSLVSVDTSVFEVIREEIKGSSLPNYVHSAPLLAAICNFLAGGLASALVATIQVPVDIITQRLIIQSKNSSIEPRRNTFGKETYVTTV